MGAASLLAVVSLLEQFLELGFGDAGLADAELIGPEFVGEFCDGCRELAEVGDEFLEGLDEDGQEAAVVVRETVPRRA